MIASWKIESVTVSRDFLRILATLTKGLMKTQKTKHVHDSTIYNFYDTLLKKSLISICSVIRMEFDASEKGYEQALLISTKLTNTYIEKDKGLRIVDMIPEEYAKTYNAKNQLKIAPPVVYLIRNQCNVSSHLTKKTLAENLD